MFTVCTSVATKIENGPKTNTKILRFLKMDRRRIRRIFVNSKILRRSSKIANSSNIFEDTKIFKGKWKIFVVKIFFQSATWTNFLSSRTQHYVGKIGVQKFKKSTYFLTFSDNFVHNIVKFSQKIFVTFGLKSSKLRRFFGIWKWTEDEDEDGSSDKNLRSFEDLRSFVATLLHNSQLSYKVPGRATLHIPSHGVPKREHHHSIHQHGGAGFVPWKDIISCLNQQRLPSISGVNFFATAFTKDHNF